MSVLAHGIGQSQDLPLPLDLVLQAGAATVVVSFLASALLWRRPRLVWRRPRLDGGTPAHQRGQAGDNPPLSDARDQADNQPPPSNHQDQADDRPPPSNHQDQAGDRPATSGGRDRARERADRAPRRLPLQVAVLLLALYIVGDALFGPQGASNPTAYAVFVWLWVGIVPVSVVFGPVWRGVNPLRTLFRALRLPAAGFRPARTANRWPAAFAMLAFVWLELIAPFRTEPRALGLCLIGYALAQLAAAAVRGEEWFARGDCFEVYSDLTGRLSPLRRRNPLAAVADTPIVPGLAAFLAVWWGSTIFDSASGSPAWAGFLQRAGHPIPYGTAGLILVCALVLVAVRRMAGRLDVTASLIPIAVAYTLAHYLSLLLVEGPRGVLLLVQQWGVAQGVAWNVAPAPGAIAVAQIGLILLGHVLAVVVAHDMALAAGPQRPVLATLADEFPIVLLMIGFTWTGLFLLFVR